MEKDFVLLNKICKLLRYDILTSTTKAGSGHPTSSLSAVELAAALFFAGFLRYDLSDPGNPLNDRFILSKGHASPLLYSLYHVAGALTYEELMTLRKFGSNLEGHPTPRFKFVDVATGSLGQGLSMGVGMALGMKLKNLKDELPKIFILLGDSEMTEGQIWEAIEIASYYKLNNLIALIDVNRLGQRGSTILGWSIEKYAERIKAFGWEPILIEDGNNIEQVVRAFDQIVDLERQKKLEKPIMIIAKTIKGKGVSFLENKEGWHGKALSQEELHEALKEIGQVDLNVRGKIEKLKIYDNLGINPDNTQILPISNQREKTESIYHQNDLISTREAYGDALVALGKSDPNIVVLDGEVSNSTYAEKFKSVYPERFFEMFIAEQNMVSTAVGLSKLGFVPFVSTFSAFLTRAFDQIRMSQYSQSNLNLIGSHSGVSIGQDGPSQMGLEDIAMMRSIKDSIILYPSDAVSAFQLTQSMHKTQGIKYLRTTRGKTSIIYDTNEKFVIGESKILRQSPKDVAAIFTAGICVHEALKAYNELKNEQISICIVDVYSIKPFDVNTLKKIILKIKNIIVVEDHYPDGGLGDVIAATINNNKLIIDNFVHLSVGKNPQSGKPEELLYFEEIDASAMIKKVKELI